MSKEEADKVFSSVYESRIDLVNFLESKKAQENWDRYGTDIFFTGLRSANTRLRRSMHRNTFRYNFGIHT